MPAGISTNVNEIPYVLDKELRRLLLYARLSTLAILSALSYEKGNQEGLPYQDLKYALDLEDGSLGPNLLWLKNKGFITSRDENVEDKTIVVYYITEDGKKAFDKLNEWLKKLLELEMTNNG